MRFYPDPVLDTTNPLYELLVNLTDGRSMLSLTGGDDGLANAAHEVDVVAFSVSGLLVPEPRTQWLVAGVGVGLIASRPRRRSRRRRG